MMDSAEKIPVNIACGPASNAADERAHAEASDRELVERCQRGLLDAYEPLVNRYRDKVYALAYSMLRNEDDAADIAQEAFVRAWQAIGRFKKNASFYTWLYRITANLCIDFVRKRDRRPTVLFEEAVDPDADADLHVPPSNKQMPTDEAQRKELREQIDVALLELSPEHRTVILLREYEGLEYAEIAKVVGCSIGTVMSRLHYARKNLYKLLKDVI